MKDRYRLECTLLVPAPESERFFLNSRVYEVFPPGTLVAHAGSEVRFWRGLFVAREVTGGVER